MDAIIKTIKATSRASIKIKDSYYTIEYGEERMIPEGAEPADIYDARIQLWTDVNEEVDKQLEDIVASLQRR